MLAGSAGMALTLGVMAFVFAKAGVGADGRPVLSHGTAVLGLTAANLYIVAFGLSWGPVMWVLLGEMFPNQMRGAGCFWRHQLGGELRRDSHFPPIVECRRSRRRIRTLHRGRRAVRAICVGRRTRDQREDVGGNIGRCLRVRSRMPEVQAQVRPDARRELGHFHTLARGRMKAE
jgi:hypothetical protein